ncbi:MAG: hypothetical protein R2698_07575 [Microthrixaceae bacterium]
MIAGPSRGGSSAAVTVRSGAHVVVEAEVPAAHIDLKVPRAPRWLRTIRMTSGAMAAALDFDPEIVEDVRTNASEVSSALIEVGTGDVLNLELSAGDGWFSMRAETSLDDPSTVQRDRLEQHEKVLAALSDHFGFDVSDGRVSGSFRREFRIDPMAPRG